MIEVLLATYNGERFLREQIDSILAQTYPNLRILARDDGSRDSTPAILAEYAAAHPDRFRVLPFDGPSGSAKMNFMRLLAASKAPYVGFSDQDDIWLPRKIEISFELMRTLEAEHGTSMPLLTFTDLRVVDQQLKVVSASFWEHEGLNPEFISEPRRLLSQNVVTGSTALMNRPLAELAQRMSPELFMHDRWVAILASLFGAAAFTREQTVLYRQHGSNVLGAVGKQPLFAIPKLRNHGVRARIWSDNVVQARALLREHGEELSAQVRSMLQHYVQCDTERNRWLRVARVVQHRFWMNDPRLTIAILWYLWDRDNFSSQSSA